MQRHVVKKALGDWVTAANNTVYQAAIDGFVLAIGTPGAEAYAYGYTDAANPPTTVRQQHWQDGAAPDRGSIMFPVKKGDYWKVTSASTVYWIPLQ